MAIKLNQFQFYTIFTTMISFLDVTGLSVVVSPSPKAKVVSGETLTITCQWSADYTGQLASVNYRLNDDDGSLGTLFMNFGTTCPDTPPNGPSYTFSCNRDTRTLGIQIPANSYSHGDRWTCEGRNNTSDSTTQTDTTTVDVVVPVTSVIISPPTTVTVDVGTSTTLTCVTQPHSRPTANVTWYRVVSGQPQMVTSNISLSYDSQNSALSTTSVLSYLPSKEDNGRTVYCVTDGGWTGSTPTTIKSNEVSLNVRYPPSHPLTVTGNTDPVYDDDDIDLRCSIKGGNPLATLSWMCPGQSVMSSPSDTSDTAISVLKITLTPFYNGANCTCTATHPAQGFTRSHTEVFNVYFAPQIRALTVTDPFPWLAREDYVGRLSCDTTNGNPSPTWYTWYRDGLVVNSLTSQGIMFGPPVSSDDGRVYKCRAENAFTDIKGSAPESQITLDVQFAPVITSDCQVKVNETDNYQCTCTAVGKPTPVVTWLPQSLSSNNVLNFPSINRNKTGLYTCKATSSSSKFGTLQTQSVLNLVVQYAPDVTLLAQNSTEGARSLVMTCNASGVPNSYTFGDWVHKYDNTLIRTLTGDETTQRRTLTLNTVSYQDIGTYTCQVQNSITGRNGQLTQTGTAFFDVRGSPKILQHESLYVTEKNRPLIITMTFISHPAPIDMFVSKTKRLNSSNDLSITFQLETVNDTIHGKIIQREGYTVILNFQSFQIQQEGDYSLTVINNIKENLLHSFKIVIIDVPDSPTDLSAKQITTESAFITWTPGLNRGKKDQTFHIWIKERNKELWTKYVTTQNVSQIMISGLQASSTFTVLLFATNEKGNSENETLQFTTLTGVQSPSAAPIIGGISGAVIGLLVIIVGIVLYRRLRNGKNTGDRSDDAPFSSDRNEPGEDGLKMNILYESAGPYRHEARDENNHPENAYAVVNKKTQGAAVYAEVQKKPQGRAVYAEVVPKKDRKAADGKDEESNDVYAEVQKSGEGKKKQKKSSKETPGGEGKKKQKKSSKETPGGEGKKKQKKSSKETPGGTIYENAGAVADKPEGVYSNTDEPEHGMVVKSSSQEGGGRRKNQDGLVYLDLEFQQKEDGSRQPVIHGIENRSEYSMVDFTKRADDGLPTKDDIAKGD